MARHDAPSAVASAGLDPRPKGMAAGSPPYLLTAVAFVAFMGLSQLLPFAQRGFGTAMPPIFVWMDPRASWEVVVPLAVIAAGFVGYRRAMALSLPVFLVVLVGWGWGLSTTIAVERGGVHALVEPLEAPGDYFGTVPQVERLGPREFARTYSTRYSHRLFHAATHPPGEPILLWGLWRLLGRSTTAVALVISLIGATGAAVAYAVAREVTGEPGAARRAAVLFATAPGVLLYSSTSSDAVFMTIVAGAIAALVRAPRSWAWAAAAGLAAAVALCFTYAALALVPLGIGVGWLAHRREDGLRVLALRAGVVLGATGVGLALVFAIVGIDLPSLFTPALHAHLHFPATRNRPYAYWWLGNVVAFLITCGVPITALLAAEVRARWGVRRPGMETVLLAVLVVGSLSGLFRGEVEHIWLFLVALAATSAGAAPRSLAGAGAGGAGQALAMEMAFRTYW